MSKNKKMTNLGMILMFVCGLGVLIGAYIYNKYSGKARAENHNEVIKKQEELGNKVDNNKKEIIDKIDTKSNIQSNKVVKKNTKNEVNAPNALIVTQNQSGGTNTVNKYGIQARRIDAGFIERFSIHFPDKKIHIRFMAFSSADAEMFDVKKQIIILLRAKGYDDVDENFNIVFGATPPIQIQYGLNEIGGATFYIPPNSKD